MTQDELLEIFRQQVYGFWRLRHQKELDAAIAEVKQLQYSEFLRIERSVEDGPEVNVINFFRVFPNGAFIESNRRRICDSSLLPDPQSR